jgi:glycosidase
MHTMSPLPRHPTLYEINTRVFLHRFDAPGRRATFRDVPAAFWDGLAGLGIHLVWLMGIWKTCPGTIPKYALTPDLVAGYRKALPDWTPEDVIGSAYAIDDYIINPALGTAGDLARLRNELQARGMRLILDFIPNHFSAETHLIGEHPELFLRADPGLASLDPATFFQPEGAKTWYAHGSDPHFSAWTDTIQVNYLDSRARDLMMNRLRSVAAMCDGVRCDMAMLPMNDVFGRTWGEAVSAHGTSAPAQEFWPATIADVKSQFPEFLFIAEAYWGMEWDLQHQGFDFTYDKGLMDLLKKGKAADIMGYLDRTSVGQSRSVHFLENHDEERAVAVWEEEPSFAAAVVIATLPGIRFFHDGQFEGRSVRLPVQLGREPEEPVREPVLAFYRRLLAALKDSVLSGGDWALVEAGPYGPEDLSHRHILSWEWRLGNDRRLVVINLSDAPARCRIRWDAAGPSGAPVFSDLMDGSTLEFSPSGETAGGLPFTLEPYRGRLFHCSYPPVRGNDLNSPTARGIP